MALTIDTKRTTLLALDFQHDNITATPGIKEKRVLENTARTNYVIEATARHAADMGYRMTRILPTIATVARLDGVLLALG